MLKRLAPVAALALALLAAPAQAAAPTPGPFDQAIDKTKSAMMVDPQAALVLAGQALGLARQGPGDADLRVATAQWLQGEALVRVGRPRDGLAVIDQALATVSARAPDTKLHGDLLLSHAGAIGALGKVEVALADYQRAFEIYRRAGDARGQAKALQNIGSIYQDAGDYQRVLKYYAQSAETYKEDPILLVSAENNKARAYTELGRYDEAVAEFHSALSVARQMQSPSLEVNVLENLAATEIKAKRYAAAEADVTRALALSGAAPEERPFLWGLAAQVALGKGDAEKARALLQRTFKGVDLTATPLLFRDFHQTAYQTYLRLGDDRLALAHLQAFKRLDDDARAVAASTNSALMAARFDFANQDLKIAKLKAGQLQRDIQLARQRGAISTGLLGGSSLVLALLAFGFVSIRKSRNEVRAANVELTGANTALEKALKAKSDFLAATSHEIRTPLNGILGMTQVLLADQALDPGVKERIELLRGSGQTMCALVDDILDLAKMQTGKLTIEKAPVDAQALLEETAALWSEKAVAKGLGFRIDLDPGLCRIVEDGGRLRQVVFNLLSNAIKFTPSGEVRLTARAEPGAGGERLVIEVADTGIGIPTESQAEIFEPFTQVDASTTRTYGGTGLGLAICRDLLQAMGGCISVDSAPGRGSTFRIVLPLVRADLNAEVEDAVAEDASPVRSLADVRLLVVDANPLAQAVLRTTFTPHARSVEVVGQAAEAETLLASRRFDRVLVEAAALAPEDSDRVGALRRLAASAACPVIVLWPAPDAKLTRRLKAAGAARVLAKPIAPAEVLDALRQSCDGEASETEACAA